MNAQLSVIHQGNQRHAIAPPAIPIGVGDAATCPVPLIRESELTV